jgi:hypothetical protein
MLVFPRGTVNVYRGIMKLNIPIESMVKSRGSRGFFITYDWNQRGLTLGWV